MSKKQEKLSFEEYNRVLVAMLRDARNIASRELKRSKSCILCQQRIKHLHKD